MQQNNSGQQNSSSPVLIVLVGCVVVSAMVSLAAVLIAVQRPVVVVVQGGAATTSGGTGGAAVAVTPPGSDAVPPASPVPTTITAQRVAAAPGADDPFNAAWDAVPVSDLDLLPQQVAAPMLERVTVRRLRVQAVRDDQRLAWRLSWDAPQPASSVETGVFTDAVAVQLPLVEGAPFTMGAKGKPVTVLHWKALWQKDVDEGFQDVHDLYPHAMSDLYWFASGKWPFPVDEAFADVRSHQWLVGVAAGSPMAQLHRKQPVEELVAEGFGSSTHVPDSASTARGQWRDGRWTVVIDRPLNPSDPQAAALQAGKPTQISFAVWDGQAGNVGGRKHYIGWVPFEVEP
ncbi:MAG: ethylbenzene dehydrogenase-related protein [Phycisphaeraceae bacterium]